MLFLLFLSREINIPFYGEPNKKEELNMKKIPCVFIEYANKEQVEWWNNIGSKLVRAVEYGTFVETATNKPVGMIYTVHGLLAGLVVNKANSFHKDLTEMVLE